MFDAILGKTLNSSFLTSINVSVNRPRDRKSDAVEPARCPTLFLKEPSVFFTCPVYSIET